MTETLDFDAFCAHVAKGLRLEPDILTIDGRLIEDVGLDSFDLVELMAIVEELGVRLPDDVAVGFDTVGDVYREYSGRITARVPVVPVAPAAPLSGGESRPRV